MKTVLLVAAAAAGVIALRYLVVKLAAYVADRRK